MPTATIRFYQSVVSDGNMRTTGGFGHPRAAETATGASGVDLDVSVPTGCNFFTVETAHNLRYRVFPEGVTPVAITDTDRPVPAMDYSEFGPVAAEGQDTVRVRFS